MRREPTEPPSTARDAAPGRHEVGATSLPVEPGDSLPPLSRNITSFIGRERELAQLHELLASGDASVITLTGPGGVGKTRLATELARSVRGFPDGAHFVDLSAVRDPELVALTVLRTLGGAPSPGRAPEDALVHCLRRGETLLLLDNFEQVLDAAPLAGRLVVACPGLTIVVTSRVRLNVSGERVVAVPPLVVPDLDEPGDATDAERLFLDRVRQAGVEWSESVATSASVGAICRMLDGLPLAIELAAAWAPVLAPDAMRDRLGDRLGLLVRGPRDVPERHRTMRDAIAWSHDLLDPETRALMRRLSVFAGGFALDAAEALTNDVRAIDGIRALVDASLLRVLAVEGGETRFTFLETIREFGHDRLVAHGEDREVHERHFAWLSGLAERFWDEVLAGAYQASLARMQAEHANIQVALGWAIEHDPSAALRLVCQLEKHWVVQGYVVEGRAWLDRCLAATGTPDPALRARALMLGSWLALQQVDLVVGESLAVEAVRRYRELGDDRTLVYALATLSSVLLSAGKLDGAKQASDEQLRLSRTLGDERHVSVATLQRGRVLLALGELDRAEAALEDALEMHRKGNRPFGCAAALVFLGSVARERGDRGRTASRYGEALVTYDAFGDWANVARCLDGLASAVGSDDARAGALLLGASAAMRERLGHPVDREDAAAWERTVERVTRALTDDAMREAWGAGAALPWEAAVAEGVALAGAIADAGEVQTGPEAADSLSPREMEVLRLLVTGMTDAEIADALFVSPRTVATHVRHIYDKLGVSSRAEAAAHAVRQGLV